MNKMTGLRWHALNDRTEYASSGKVAAKRQMDDRVNQLELRVLYNISQIIGQALNLDQTLEIILGILSEYLLMNRATVTLRDGETGHLVIHASHGLSAEEKKRGVYRLDEGVTGLIFTTAEPFVVPDIRKEPLFLNKTGSRKIEKGQIAFIGVPIVLHGTPTGVLSVDRLFAEDVSFEEDIRFLTILAALVAQLVSLNRQVKAREDNLLRANLSLKADLSEKCSNFFTVGKSPAVVDVQDLIRKVPLQGHGLAPGRIGHGQDAGGSDHPRIEHPGKQPLRKGELRSLARQSPRIGTVRPRKRCFYRSGGDQSRTSGRGRRRNHFPR